jgi:SAM-dependent MidA family methyltransferase
MTTAGDKPDLPYDLDARRDTPLATKIKEHLARSGNLTMAGYVDLCLNDPEHGYYRTQDVIGQTGDFTTAPEISQIFGELIGLWCAVVWQQMGSPQNLSLIELGPGRGTLMTDALRATRNIPAFHDALTIVLVEQSEKLRQKQAQALATTSCPINWVSDYRQLFETAPISGDRPAIIIANEFFDALPASTLICHGPSNGKRDENVWLEQGVTFDGEKLIERSTSHSHVVDDTSNHPPDEQSRRLNERFPKASPGDSYIDQSQIFADFAHMLSRFDRAAALIIDYGHTEPALGDTLQAVRDHHFEHPLTSPGEADLSYQVGFGELSEALTRESLSVDGPTTQAEYLGALGLAERASRLMAANPTRAHEIEVAALRLVAPNSMGTRFKAIGARSPTLPPLPGLPQPTD